MGQTVNLLSYDFGGSNPSLPTFLRLERSLVFCGSSSVDRALAFQAEGRGFESRFPLTRKPVGIFRPAFFILHLCKSDLMVVFSVDDIEVQKKTIRRTVFRFS